MRKTFEIGVGSPCPHCEVGEIMIKRSKFGEFFSCSRFPYCAFSQKIEEEETDWTDDLIEEDNEDSDLIFE
jgi:ssDNA-binding Zn-finger/Zn-ribbon topoisomerase 1